MKKYYNFYVNGSFLRAFDTEKEVKNYQYEFQKTHHVKTEIIVTGGNKK